MSGAHHARARRRRADWLMVLSYLVAVLAGALVGLAFPASPSGHTVPVVASAPPVVSASPVVPARPRVRTTYYTVLPGDTLTAIAVRFHRPSYRPIWAVNRYQVPNPDLIHPGEVLIIGVTSR